MNVSDAAYLLLQHAHPSLFGRNGAPYAPEHTALEARRVVQDDGYRHEVYLQAAMATHPFYDGRDADFFAVREAKRTLDSSSVARPISAAS